MTKNDFNDSARRIPAHVRDWWRAEAAGDDATAESALFALFAELPELAPAPDFAVRVVTAAGLSPSVDPRLRWAARFLLVAALLATGASLLVVFPLLGLLPRLAPDLSAGGLAGLLSWWVGPLELLLTFGRVVRGLVDALAAAVLTPEVGSVVLGAFLLGWLAFRSLGRLLEPRSMIHVH